MGKYKGFQLNCQMKLLHFLATLLFQTFHWVQHSRHPPVRPEVGEGGRALGSQRQKAASGTFSDCWPPFSQIGPLEILRLQSEKEIVQRGGYDCLLLYLSEHLLDQKLSPAVILVTRINPDLFDVLVHRADQLGLCGRACMKRVSRVERNRFTFGR